MKNNLIKRDIINLKDNEKKYITRNILAAKTI